MGAGEVLHLSDLIHHIDLRDTSGLTPWIAKTLNIVAGVCTCLFVSAPNSALNTRSCSCQMPVRSPTSGRSRSPSASRSASPARRLRSETEAPRPRQRSVSPRLGPRSLPRYLKLARRSKSMPREFYVAWHDDDRY
jgi:hypothetical protein